MFNTGMMGYRPSCVLVLALVVLSSLHVHGKPQDYQKSTQHILDFAPELMLEPSLESAVSPISLLPRGPSADSRNSYTPTKQGEISEEDLADPSLDLDGPQDKWEHDPDILDSDIPTPQRWDDGVPDPPKDKVVVPPNLEDDVDVDRIDGQLFGFLDGDSDEDLGPSEEWKRDETPGSFLRSPETGSGHGPLPHQDADEEIPWPQLVDKDMDIDEEMAPPNTNLPMSDDVSAFLSEMGFPGMEMVEKDVDVDRPTSHDISLLETRPTTIDGKTLGQWKELALAGLAMREDMNLHGDAEDITISDVDVDNERSPFDDVDEEDVDEVPKELVRQVVEAMEARPAWREFQTPEQDRGAQARDSSSIGDSDEYFDWPPRRAEPKNSRLIALIFQTFDAPAPDDNIEDSDEDDDMYENKINIWQILTNFPFPMLVGRSSDDKVIIEDFDDDYDEEYYDDYEDDDYDDDDYDEDDYDEDDYDDDDYEDEEEEDDKDDDGKYDVTQHGVKKDTEKDRENEIVDFFYEYEYEDCDDCSENADDYIDLEKDDFTILSLPPIFTR